MADQTVTVHTSDEVTTDIRLKETALAAGVQIVQALPHRSSVDTTTANALQAADKVLEWLKENP